MSATIYDVPDLVRNNFPDRLFERTGNDIKLVEDPSQATNVDTSRGYAKSDSRPSVSRELLPSAEIHQRTASESDEPPASSPHNITVIDKIFHFLKTKSSPVYDEETRKWTGWPKTSEDNTEGKIAEYLNEIVAAGREYLDGVVPVDSGDDWVFSSKYKNRPVRSYGRKRKPGIVLIPRSEHKVEAPGGWSNIRAVAEVKFRIPSNAEPVDQLAEYVRLCFRCQRTRRFVLGFSLTDTTMSLWKFDRSGVLVSEEFDVHENPIDFLRIILGLVLGNNFYIGLDPSFTRKDGKNFVELEGKTYEILKKIWAEPVVRGRGSVVFHVKDEDGREYALKEQWVDRSRKMKEFKILEKLKEKNVQKVTQLVAHQLVHFQVGDEIVKDSTANDRSSPYAEKEVKDKRIETRDHYRILLWPFGDNLESFRSKKELVSVFRDLVEVIKDLRDDDVGVVHRDISDGNVILVQQDGHRFRRGYLIDFDNAAEVSHPGEAEAEQTGTVPYMALDILQGEPCNHEYYHDLESLFYVLIWMCLTQDGPENKTRRIKIADLPLRHWCPSNPADKRLMRNVVGMKGYQLDLGFTRYILDELPDYFKESYAILAFLQRIRRIIFRQTPYTSSWDNKKVVSEREKSMKDRNMNDVVSEIFEVCDATISRLEDEPAPLDSQTLTGPASNGKATDLTSGSEESDTQPATPQALDIANMPRVNSTTQGTMGDDSMNAGGTSDLHRSALKNSQACVGQKRSRDEVDLRESHFPPSPCSPSSKRPKRSSEDH